MDTSKYMDARWAMAARGDDGSPRDSAAEDSAALGDEMLRMVRHVRAWKQRLPTDEWGDRLLLGHLADSGPRRATDLAADTLLDLSTVSRQIRSLVERGLVERQPDPVDRRGALLSATDAGLDAVRAHRARRDEQLAHVLGDWPAEDRQTFVRLLRRFNDDFAAHRLRPGPAGPQAGDAASGAAP
ncbi:MarR family winged helix-turn-helix transcriptional regulator [Streptomyces sp. NBC_01190]|uniref:MarR family winged helix-turn-helix transcriptional regulator n=1 Tax=Streptomyces sp. NBC_01190 TaxID=2903767 RepID=UPI00386F309A|nr:MarR family winged helix-turn-helix transcriptional regulator [Streptomyces sp. NBC_01190]